MTLEIREPDVADVNDLASAAYASWGKGVAPYVSEISQQKISELDFSDFIRGNPEQVLAAFMDGQAVGYVATEYGDNYISDLWVDPAYEGRGIGTALIKAVTEVIRSRGHDTMTLEVLTENTRALELYRHLGFVTTWQGVRTDGYLNEPLNKTGMVKALA